MTKTVSYTKTFHFISDEGVKSTKEFFPGQNFEPYLIFMSNARSGASDRCSTLVGSSISLKY
jgi:hypothetical protein